MAKTGVSKFRFVSPGVQIAEIDNSQIPQEPQPIGPIIIGSAVQGPALRPVQVNSFSDFVEIFGMPSAGDKNGDIWRDGIFGLAPTYAAYAAQAWFANASPVTFVRLLGRQHTNKDGTDASKAGWKVGSSYAQDYSTGGAFGLWLIDSGTSAGTRSGASGTLAAIFYCANGRVDLSGTVLGAAGKAGSAGGVSVYSTASAGTLIESIGTDKMFKAVIRSGTTDTADNISETIDFNFNKNTKKYIRNVFSTNPTLLDPDTRLYAAGDRKSYFLGETFDRDVAEYIENTGDTSSRILGVITPLANSATDYNINQANLAKASTGWVISQDLGSYANFQAENMTKLFRFKSLEGGEWDQANLKISIRDITAPANELEEFGTFTVEIRGVKDSDVDRDPLEVYTNCTLNKNSPNYIAAKIGDSYVEWSDTDRRYREYGDYPNRSRYVYVHMNPSEPFVNQPALLPYGYLGPLRFKGFMVTGAAGTSSLGNIITTAKDGTKYTDIVLEKPGLGALMSGSEALDVGSDAIISWLTGTAGAGNMMFTGTFLYPRTYLRNNTSDGYLDNPANAYFGLDTSRTGSNTTTFDTSYIDTVRGLPGGFIDGDQGAQTPADAAAGDTEYSYVFSLDDVTRHSGSTANATMAAQNPSTTTGYYLSGSRVVGASLTATGTAPSYKGVLDEEFDQFTMPMFGGFNGIDIRERNPFNDYKLGGTAGTTQTEFSSYAYNSVKTAIDACSDPEIVECNVMTIPGVTTEGITNHVLNTCQRRGDALGIIDIAGNFIPRDDRSSYIGNDSDSTVRGTVSTAVSTLNNRVINNSYGVTYYPWVMLKDENSGRTVWAPPSIAAIGTYANTQHNFELWFAPAGFTRGGLSERAAGIPVNNVKQRLTSKERDQLYAANINPIAQFPAEGIVIFGQKTLQKTRSALDRVNVRRLMIFVKKEISRIASRLLFDQNVETTWDRFTGQVIPFLDSVRMRLGLEDYKVILDKTTTTPDLVDRNIMYARIYLKPARAIEFIAIDFIITNSGAAFED